MTLDQFKKDADLITRAEVDRACYLAFYFLKSKAIREFGVADVSRWMLEAGGAKPNQSRLQLNLRASRNTLKAQRGWRLREEFIQKLEKDFPALCEQSQEVADHGTILPEIDFRGSRGYIEALARQINASYENNVFDGCAVLMRRLIEVLLILSYRHLKIESVIQDKGGDFLMLEAIINDAKGNRTLGLSRNSKGSLDTFRKLGNFSAHKIEYLCRREYIEPHIQEFRALFGELLHKAGIRV